MQNQAIMAPQPSDDPPGEATAHSQSYYDIDNHNDLADNRPLICSSPSSYASPPRSTGSASLDNSSRGTGSREDEAGCIDYSNSRDNKRGLEDDDGASLSSRDEIGSDEHLSTSALSSDSSSYITRPQDAEDEGEEEEGMIEVIHQQAPYYDEEDAGVDVGHEPYHSYRGHKRQTVKANNLSPTYYQHPQRYQDNMTPAGGAGHHLPYINRGQNQFDNHLHHHPSNNSGTPSYGAPYNYHLTPPPPAMPYNTHDPNILNMNIPNTTNNPYQTPYHDPNNNPNTQYHRQESTFTSYAARHAQHYADPVESVTGTTTAGEDYEDETTASNFCSESLYTQAYPESFVTNPPPEDGLLPYPNSSANGGGYEFVSPPGGSNRNRAMEGIAQHLQLVSLDGSSPRDNVDQEQQQQFQQMLVKYHHSSLGSGHTENLTDDFDDEEEDEEDGDDDVVEETYRQLPPPRYPPPQGNRGIQEQALVVRGRDPEECTSPTDHHALALRRRRDDESVNLSNIHQLHPITESPNQKDNNNNKQVAIVKTSKEVVADIKHQLALHDPITTHQLRDPTSSKYTGYQHCFITVKTQHRFLMLYTFLKRNCQNNKIIIFFSTTKSTQYYAKLLARLKFNVRAIHNGQSKEKFLEEFLAFSKKDECGILCVPDFQGRDLAIPPSCSWLVQFEPCSDPSEYIFRVGRISSENKSKNQNNSSNKKSKNEVCRALLFLTPEQFAFLEYYKATKVKFYEYEIHKISRVQKDLIKLIKNDARLRKLGSEAYHAYLLAYASHEYRDIYNVHELDSSKVALSFGFEKPPSKEDAAGADKRISFQETIHKREQIRWKPSKKNTEKKMDANSWMGGTKKSWRYADVHADKMRGGGNSQSQQQQQQQMVEKDGGRHRDPDGLKPHTIRTKERVMNW